jgi:G2/mitotic-specific cyclin-B, other
MTAGGFLEAGGASSSATLRADIEDAHDPQCFTAYVNEIHDYHRSMEVSRSCSRADSRAADPTNTLGVPQPPTDQLVVPQATRTAKPDYMRGQGDINEKMRAILIDWLLEVHFKFKLLPETLYLTVNVIDRFLELRPVQRTKLQLVGVTGMLIASKFEEIYPPEVKDFVFITSKAFSHDQILAMEAKMLNALKFEVCAPTAWVFLNRYARVGGIDSRTKLLAQYYTERCLQEYSMLQYSPSKQAAAALYAASLTLGGSDASWSSSDVEGYTGYCLDELREVAMEMEKFVNHQSSNLKAARKKFSSKRFSDIAALGISVSGGSSSSSSSA